MSYTILDKNLRVCGRLSPKMFYADQRTVQIADDSNGDGTNDKAWDDQLTITVSYDYPQVSMLTEGYHIIKQGNDGKLYCFRITQWEDQTIGQTHVRIITAENLAEWNLLHTVPTATTLTNSSCHDSFTWLLGFTDWELVDNGVSGPMTTEEISLGSTAQAVAQQMTTDYSVEIRAYVELYNGKVSKKCFELSNQLGEITHKRITYSKNATGITRTGADNTLFTKLHVYGGTPSNSDTPNSIASVNNGCDYLIDDTANDKYNEGNAYLEGWVQNEAIVNTSGLLYWGKEQLAYYNHPKYNYTINVAQLDWNPNLGDTIDIVDYSMEPVLTVSARVLQKVESESDPTLNQIVLGEFVELSSVTPADIYKLHSAASAAQQVAEQAMAYKVDIFTPDGTDFANQNEIKRVICRVYKGNQDVTYQIPTADYIWEKILPDGTHDTDWESQHSGVGNIITVTYDEVVISTVRCKINNGASSTPVRFTDESHAALFCTLTQSYSGIDGETNNSVQQFAIVDAANNCIYWTQEYYGKNRPNDSHNESFQVTRTKMDGTYLDSMLCLHGGHGTSFGIDPDGDTMYIWSAYYNPSDSKWTIARFPYVANKKMDYGDSSMWSWEMSTYTRVSFDPKHNIVMASQGNSPHVYYALNKNDVLAKKWLSVYQCDDNDLGFAYSDNTFQTSYVDFPYLYMDSGMGGVDDSDGTAFDEDDLWCFDMRAQSLVYRCTYNFSTIKRVGKYDEPESISVYYDTDGKRWIIQGFAFGDGSPRLNQLYRLQEVGGEE
jgi:phage minor structural protein